MRSIWHHGIGGGVGGGGLVDQAGVGIRHASRFFAERRHEMCAGIFFEKDKVLIKN